jgi:hypothetical protein
MSRTGGRIPKEQVQLAKRKEAERYEQMQNDSKNDAYFDRLEAQKGQAPKTNKWFMDKTEAEKNRYQRGMKGRQDQLAKETNDRIAEQRRIEDLQWQEEERRRKHGGLWGTITDGLNSALSMVPVIGEPLSMASSMLTSKLRGEGKVQCNCGSVLLKKNMAKHKLSKKHLSAK